MIASEILCAFLCAFFGPLPSVPTYEGAEVQDLASLTAEAREAETAELRLAALESIAALQLEGQSPSRAVTEGLVVGLNDEEAVVRKRTVELLDSKQHPEVAVTGLVKLGKSETKRWKEKCGDVLRFVKGEGRDLMLEHYGALGSNRFVAEKAAKDYEARSDEFVAELDVTGSVLDAQASQLALWKDDRSVKALASQLKLYSRCPLADSAAMFMVGERVNSAADGLLELGTQRALGSLIDCIQHWESITDKAMAKTESFDLVKAKPRERYEWSDYLGRTLVSQVRVKDLVTVVRKFARGHKLPVPSRNDNSKAVWRDLTRAARKVLPKSLGRVEVADEPAEKL